MSKLQKDDGAGSERQSARVITRDIAPVAEYLEMVMPEIVAKDDVAMYLRDLGLEKETGSIVSRLAEYGWLLPLRTRGYYEFAPARRAGRISTGDPFIELRATLRRKSLDIAVSFDSAAWLLGLSPREPAKHVLAIPYTQKKVPAALSDFRLVHTWGRLELKDVRGVRVWRPATLLAQMALLPSAYRNWADVMEWLEEAFRQVDLTDLELELEGAPPTGRVRLAYLADRAGFKYYADELFAKARAHGTVYLGRSRGGTFYKKYDLVDSLLVESQKR
jgi:hypothetical protein